MDIYIIKESGLIALDLGKLIFYDDLTTKHYPSACDSPAGLRPFPAPSPPLEEVSYLSHIKARTRLSLMFWLESLS